MKRHLITGVAVLVLVVSCAQEKPMANDPSPAKKPAASSYAATGWPAKTLPELSAALQSGEVTSETLVQAYLDRIEAIDRSGPRLQAIISLNPAALDIARQIDERRAAGEDLGSLAGIPVLLKDNIDTSDAMPTTAGALALAENFAVADAPLAKGLRDSGAIILGKTNLSQWANFRSNSSVSGWSAVGGQVHNPHMLDRTPCGSSSGSGAATAASLAAGSVGTETNGSIICPSNVNGIVGFKPTVGLVSQTGIIPISHTQDTAGPMTRTVRGAALMLTAMATGQGAMDFSAPLDAATLNGKRVGVLRFAVGDNADINNRFDAALEVLKSQGAELVEIPVYDPGVEGMGKKSFDLLKSEFKAGLDIYLAGTPDNVPVKSLADLIAYNNTYADQELALFNQDILEASQETRGLEDEAYLTAVKDVLTGVRENGIDKFLNDNPVDFLVSPSGPLAPRTDPVNGDVWPEWSGAGSIAARAGYPHLTVPMGDVHGIPIGLSFFGTAGQDADILGYGYVYEQSSHLRRDPGYLISAEDRPEIAAAMLR